jgi:uncharacterized protein (DUF1330 family)
MPAYAIFDITVLDPVRYEDYKKLAPPAIAAYGGKYLVRGGTVGVLEGDWNPSRIVILEFPTADQAKAWIDSPEYREARALRHATAQSQAILIEGMLPQD